MIGFILLKESNDGGLDGLLDVDVVVEESGEVNFIWAGKEIGVGLLGLGVFPRLTGTGTLPYC